MVPWVVDQTAGGAIGQWGWWAPGNPLGAGWRLPAAKGVHRVACWSGTLAEGLFDTDFHTWGPKGMVALEQRLDALVPECVSLGLQLVLRPHARHVISDAQRAARLMLQRSGSPLRLLLDPASMLTAGMLPAAEDHLTRMFEVLGPMPAVAGVLLANVAAPATAAADEPDAGEPLRLVGLREGAGVLDPALIERLCREHVPTAVPRFIVGG